MYIDLDIYLFTPFSHSPPYLVSMQGLSCQLGGAGETKVVSKVCLIESKRNCFPTVKCFLGKKRINFIPSCISVGFILILPFCVFVCVFHPQDLNRSVSGGGYAALNCGVK